MVDAGVAELVYAHDSKSCLARDKGSTPFSGTKKKGPGEYPGTMVAWGESYPLSAATARSATSRRASFDFGS